jgi:hypothetical protein
VATARAEGFACAGGAVNLFSPQSAETQRSKRVSIFVSAVMDGRGILGMHDFRRAWTHFPSISLLRSKMLASG